MNQAVMSLGSKSVKAVLLCNLFNPVSLCQTFKILLYVHVCFQESLSVITLKLQTMIFID